MKTRYIAIEREYGSGGTKIARQLSQTTGIPCYGREILEEVSKKQNVSVEELERYEEKVTNSLLYSIYFMAQASSGNVDILSQEGYIYLAEQDVIQTMAQQGRAIFLGHCAAEALKDLPGLVRVFIRCSDEAQKKQRIQADYGIPEQQIESTQKRFDKKRANYYSANTGRKWDDPRSYDLILDSGVLGIDGCVSVLNSLFRG